MSSFKKLNRLGRWLKALKWLCKTCQVISLFENNYIVMAIAVCSPILIDFLAMGFGWNLDKIKDFREDETDTTTVEIVDKNKTL